ncbi:MAG: translesion error-prone DNA polymerase V autoproteolytic subunit [Bacteroidales bacterium]
MALKFELFAPETKDEVYITFAESLVKAGFPSPAEDHGDLKLDLNKELIKNPSSTFFAKVSGQSMIEDGINDGDLLIIDKSIEPFEDALAVCYLDGEFTLKRVKREKEAILLVPANPEFKPIRVTRENDFMIWGVVRYVIKKM